MVGQIVDHPTDVMISAMNVENAAILLEIADEGEVGLVVVHAPIEDVVVVEVEVVAQARVKVEVEVLIKAKAVEGAVEEVIVVVIVLVEVRLSEGTVVAALKRKIGILRVAEVAALLPQTKILRLDGLASRSW